MGETLPPAQKFRWPILVVLDGQGDEPSMLDLKIGVGRRLHLNEEPEASSVSPTVSSAFISRFVQALTDLNAAGMIDADEEGLLWITEAGKRASEIEVEQLPEAGEERPDDHDDLSPPDPPKATLKDYFFAVLESIVGH